MYERKIPIDLDCPLRLTMSLIDSKWKSCILDELRYRSMRPSELHKALPEATPRVLDIQLKELVEDGLVKKTIFPELPPRSEYSITSLGLTLIPIIDAMLEWGKRIRIYLRENMGGEFENLAIISMILYGFSLLKIKIILNYYAKNYIATWGCSERIESNTFHVCFSKHAGRNWFRRC